MDNYALVNDIASVWKYADEMFPAFGSSNSAIEMTLPELEHYSGALGWVHVCKDVS